VDTRREIPEALKPRTIAIQSSANGNGRKVIENTADAA
jgi:hypothetical protein